jgi:23S rRNA (uracil1939-C5)-methyltransferase
VGKKQRLTIERLANDGRGIAFFEGRTWFVSGALAGEEVEARVLGAHGKVVEARPSGVRQPRAPPGAVRHWRCGGCSVQHLPMTNNWRSNSACSPSSCSGGRRRARENGRRP